MDPNSKMVMMHHMVLLQTMMKFANETLGYGLTLTLDANFAGSVEGTFGQVETFNDIPAAVDLVRKAIEGFVAVQIESYNNELKAHVEHARKLDASRKVWKQVGDQLLEGVWGVPEEKPEMFERASGSSPSMMDPGRVKAIQDQMPLTPIQHIQNVKSNREYTKKMKAIRKDLTQSKKKLPSLPKRRV
jgi:hypothetical protein